MLKGKKHGEGRNEMVNEDGGWEMFNWVKEWRAVGDSFFRKK